MKAFECLLEIRYILPVLDVKLADVKLSQALQRYLIPDLDNIDFQIEDLDPSEIDCYEEEVEEEPSDMSPRKDKVFDESGRSLKHSAYFSQKLHLRPLALMKLCELQNKS